MEIMELLNTRQWIGILAMIVLMLIMCGWILWGRLKKLEATVMEQKLELTDSNRAADAGIRQNAISIGKMHELATVRTASLVGGRVVLKRLVVVEEEMTRLHDLVAGEIVGSAQTLTIEIGDATIDHLMDDDTPAIDDGDNCR